MNTQSFLSVLVDYLEEPVLCYDNRCRYVFANRAATQYTGLPVEEMLGRTDTELFGSEASGLEFAVGEFFRTRGTSSRADHSITFRGKTYLFNSTTKLITIEGEEYLLLLCRDVGEERKTLQNLMDRNREYVKELENQMFLFESAVRCNPFAMSFNNMNREFLMVNQAYSELFGYSEEELLGRSAELLYADREDYEKLGLETSQMNFNSPLSPIEVNLRKKSGETFLAELVRTRVQKTDGTPVGFLGFVRDVTQERLMLEKIEEERGRAVHSSRMASLGEMAASVAHEINNPLEIINSCATIILKEVEAGGDPKHLNRMAQKIQNTVQRIAEIISALRRISREGSSDPIEAVLATDVLEDVLCFAREKFEGEGIEFRVRFAVPEDSKVYCRRVELSQVLLNLLSNAYDAVKRSPRPWVEIEISQCHEHFSFSVRDSGDGVATEIAEKIMEPFFTTKGIGDGTGLGLSISRGIVNRHGGDLRLVLDEANTTFRLDLPRWPQEKV